MATLIPPPYNPETTTINRSSSTTTMSQTSNHVEKGFCGFLCSEFSLGGRKIVSPLLLLINAHTFGDDRLMVMNYMYQGWLE